ncbi:hypothetical protein GGH12_001764 [Coemansia sp. RSA 1822]|nr:hypothetical protein LPJ76_003566 [Coemansia sp. RSA 638]KAJ2120613.1 hypothetical protein IW147_004950 [Coemansia sp. RSA 720]KAJ2541673.1 hypothetical protein GGF49_003465 [Coemansia sp. RSA 1853]KAJ2564796.1 hypothetical protein GGH12_001764 [Coemansia sp. RSA 1822]
MLRSLVGRTLSLLRPTVVTSRSYVTARQVVVAKEALQKAEIVVNSRTSIPEPTLSRHAMRYLRTDPLLSQLVNMIMRDGKKSRAERLVQTALLDIRRHTNTDPMRVLSDAINLACPLMDTKSARQGSKVVQVPRALSLRQRRRRAIVWILDSADRRNERCFSMRLSGELQAIVNGTSGVLEKKLLLHKAVLANRSFIRTQTRKIRK